MRVTKNVAPLGAGRDFHTVEILRLLAVFDVIWRHAHGRGPGFAGSVGLTSFLLLIPTFAVLRPAPGTLREFTLRRAQRYLAPWLFWSAFYGLLAVLRVSHHERAWTEEFEATMLLYGTTVPLWFLPFGFALSLLSAGVCRRLGTITLQVIVIFVTLGVVAIGCASVWLRDSAWAVPFPQWLGAAPSLFLGLALGGSLAQSERRRQLLGVTLTCVASALAAFACGRLGYHDVYWEYLVTPLWVALAFFGNLALPKILAFSRLSYGIYLLHPFVILYVVRIHEMQLGRVLEAGLVFGVCAAITYALQKTPLRRFV